MITGKAIVIASLAATPAAAVVVSPAFDWNPIIAALIGAIPPTCGVVLLYFQGRKTQTSVDGVVSKLLVTNTEKATAEAVAGEHPKILQLATEKATAEATIEAVRAEQARVAVGPVPATDASNSAASLLAAAELKAQALIADATLAAAKLLAEAHMVSITNKSGNPVPVQVVGPGVDTPLKVTEASKDEDKPK